MSDSFLGNSSDVDSSEFNFPLVLLRQILPEANLTNIQASVFIYSWHGKTYKEIAKTSGYDSDYLKDVGHKLWKSLSQLMGEPISKSNFCSILRRRHQELQSQRNESQVPKVLEFPQSPQYISNNTFCSDLEEVPGVPVFHGRGKVLSTLEKWTIQENNRLIGIFGLGGVGKTAIAAKCVELFTTSFEGVIWRSLRDTPDFDDFLMGLIQSLTEQEVSLPKTPHEKVSCLIQSLNRHRYLLIIDDCSAILDPDMLAGHYRESYESYGLLLRRLGECKHQSTVFVVSREKPGGVVFRDNLGFPVRNLYLQELTRDASQEALVSFGIAEVTSRELFDQYGGNPYVLRIVAKTVVDLFDGDVSGFLTHNNLIYGDIRGLMRQQFSRLTRLEHSIVDCITHSSEPMSIIGLRQKVNQTDDRDSLVECLESLYHRGFLHKTGSVFDLPRLFRQYAIDLKAGV